MDDEDEFRVLDDERFAESLDLGIFGSGGALDEEYEEEDEEIPPSPQAMGAAPMAVSGIAPLANTPSSLGAAMALFTFVGGGAAGWYFSKSLSGAVGGALGAAGARNLYFAQKSFGGDLGTSVRQGMIGLVGVGLGGYLLYQASQKGK
jgi:hypothetical protein